MAAVALPLETYRSTDPIENLQLRVTLRKRGTQGERRLDDLADETSTAPSDGKKKKRGGKRGARDKATGSDEEGEASDEDKDEGESDGEAASKKPLRLEKDESDRLVCPPRLFRWQEKRFGPVEVRSIRRDQDEEKSRRRAQKAGGLAALLKSSSSSLGELLGMRTAPLSNHHREIFRRLDAEATARGEEYEGDILYSRVHSESYVDTRDVSAHMTDSGLEVLTPLARSVLTGAFGRQHRDMLGEAACVSMHIFAALPADEVEEAEAERGASLTPRGASTPRGRLSRALGRGDSEDGDGRTSEVLLAVLRLYPGGRLDMKPPLSFEANASADIALDDRLARWWSVPGTRYEYMLENLAEGLAGRAGDSEAIADRLAKLSLSAQSVVGRPSVPELDFAAPPRKSARVHYQIEITSALGFGPNPLYVAYYSLAAPGWKLLPHCVASAITQTSAVVGADECAVFGFPIELSLESDGPPTAPRPPLSLFFSVVSRDAHERMSVLGYAVVSPPPEAGSSEVEVGAWRLGEGRVDSLRRFFVGGTEELTDLRALGLPPGFDMSKPSCLNRHGLQTVSTGSLRVRIHTIVQQQQPPAPPKAGVPKTKGDATRKPELRKSRPDMGTLKGVFNVSALARSETAADRVKKRLEERRRAERP